MAEQYNSGILLESGTNEIEIMEFTIDGSLYGINVAKVREIIMSAPVKRMPHAHPAVEGIFKPRDIVITVVDLPKYLGVEMEKMEKDLFIVTNFNKMFIAFRVHTVVGISRISWRDIQKPDKTVAGGNEGVATGIAQCGGDLVTILDFEKIVAEIAPETTIQMSEIERLGHRERQEAPILVAEDETGTVQGYAFCVIQPHRGETAMEDFTSLYLDDLCVDEACRGKHVGGALYRAVLELARSLGCYNVTLNVWSCNPEAMRFYEKCGLQTQKIGMEVIL